MELQGVVWGGMDLPGSGQGQVVGSCKCNTERSGSIKGGKFLD